MGNLMGDGYVIKLVPASDNVTRELEEVKSLFDTDFNANVDVSVQVRKEIIDFVQFGLKTCCIQGDFDAATRTQEIIVRGQFPQSLLDLIATIRTWKGDWFVLQ